MIYKNNFMEIKRGKLWTSAVSLLFLAGILNAQPNYRPHGSKNKDHSYFKNGFVNFIGSSHQDIAWMDSIGACIVYRDEKMITPALHLLATNPAYCFSVEDALSLREYLERHPERYDDILRYTKEGRLEWGATYNMPYESMYDGESLIRQMYLGQKWLKKTLPGCSFLTAWSVDVPGRALQMPQILAKSGVKYLFISRHEGGLYRWNSKDGSSVIMFTPGHYDGSGRDIFSAENDNARGAALLTHIDAWSIYFKTNKLKPALPIMLSSDWKEPNDYHSFVQSWNKEAADKRLPKIKYATAATVIEDLNSPRAVYENITGERPDVWLYIHGPTHERALTASRKASRTLVAAEMFSAIDACLKKNFSLYPQSDFTKAWENAIYADHGWGGKHGDLTDQTFRTKFEEAYKIAAKILQQRLNSITRNIGFGKKGKAIVVFNPLSRERTDQTEVSLKVYGQDTLAYKLIEDASGEEVPVQLVKAKSAEGSDEVTTLSFVAEKIPSMGYKTYRLIPYSAALQNGVPVKPTNPSPINAPTSDFYENKFYKIQFGAGGLKSIFDKQLQKELIKTDNFLCGEIFQLESVGNGAGEFSDIQPVSVNGLERTSQYQPKWNCTEFGAVRKSWEFSQQTKFATIRQTITLYENLKQIDFKADILGFSGERYREYRIAFPLNQTESKIAYEVPMGAVEIGADEIKGAAGYSYGTQDYSTECSKVHPREVQDWINSSKDNVSVTIGVSAATFDWIDPTDSHSHATVLQPILLASRKSCHGEGNYYLQPGNHSYSFSLTSSEGDWHNSIAVGKYQNQPLQPVAVNVGEARKGLPSSYSFAGADAENILISAIKKSEDENSIIMRMVDLEGKTTHATINWFGQINEVTKTNIIEEEDKPLLKNVSEINMKITPYSIETIRIR